MKKLLKVGDSIGLIACSNGLSIESKDKIDELERVLTNLGIKVVYGNDIYRKISIYNGTPREKAEGLMELFRDNSIKAIFDISGGDLANGILDYLDFNEIANNKKPFFGYSDLSVLLNSLNRMSGLETYYYQIRNLVGKYKDEQIRLFKTSLLEGKEDLFNYEYNWIRGESMSGEVVGGNLRCFLKLAGTKYIPSFKNKVLFLESLGGDVGKITTYLTQYKQINAFTDIQGIILGSFTEMEEKRYNPTVEEILLDIVEDKNIPIIKTKELGHGQDSKAIIIGRKFNLKKQ